MSPSGTPSSRTWQTSLIVALGTALVSIVIATPAAYALAHFRLRVTVVIVFVLLLTQMIPTVTLTTPMFLIFNQFGLDQQLSRTDSGRQHLRRAIRRPDSARLHALASL